MAVSEFQGRKKTRGPSAELRRKMQKEESDLAVRTKNFALQIISSFPNYQEQQKRRSWGTRPSFLLLNFYFLL